MLDKELIKNKFQKSISTYTKYAFLQPEIAKKLASFFNKSYDDILEIGSYCGFLTREIVENVGFKTYTALDIVDSFDCIKNLNPEIKFILGDIEQIALKEKYNLITSSSSLQWCEDFKSVIKKLKAHLKPNGHIVISIFGKQNLYQIKETFGISLNYPDISEIREMFSKNAKIIEETKTLQFENPYEILKHLKYTGVNSLKNNIKYSTLKEKMRILDSVYQNKLTYNPVYIID